MLGLSEAYTVTLTRGSPPHEIHDQETTHSVQLCYSLRLQKQCSVDITRLTGQTDSSEQGPIHQLSGSVRNPARV